MKFAKKDWGVMRRSLITLSLAATFSLALISISARQSALAGKDWRDAQNQLRAAQSELSNAKQEQSIMSNDLAEYSVAVERHLIGEEARLDWLENLDKLHQQKLLPDFHYTIGPQKNYATPPALNSGNFNLHYSEMKVQLELLHEVQLLDFFDALRSQIKGWYQLDSCTLVRAPSESANIRSNLKAECNGGWVTLQNRSAQP